MTGGGEGGGRPAAGNGASTSPALPSPEVFFVFLLPRKSFERALRAPAGDDETDVVAGSERDSLSGSPRPRPVPFVRAVAAAPSFAGGRGAAGPHLAPADAGLAAFGRASRARQCISTCCICLNHAAPRPETRRTTSTGRQGAGGGGRGRRWSRAEFEIFQAPASSRSNHQPCRPPHPCPIRTRPFVCRKNAALPPVWESPDSLELATRLETNSQGAHTLSRGGRTHTLNHSRARPIFPCPVAWSPRYPKIERTRPSQKLSKLSTLKHSQGSRTVVGGGAPHTMALQGGGRGRGQGGE